MKWFSFLFLFSILLFSCNSKDDPFEELDSIIEEAKTHNTDSMKSGFNIYYLEDENMTLSNITNTDLYELDLEDQPFITQNNIELYDTSAHIIQLFEDVKLPKDSNKLFVVATDSVRHYYGVVWSVSSSNFHRMVVGIEAKPRFYSDDIIRLSLSGSGPVVDCRLNDEIIQTLQDYNVFHSGISCSIDSVRIIENDSVNNNCRLSYTYTIKNNDVLNLYMFDPLKMGEGLFHYYNNGVHLIGDNKVYRSYEGAQAPEEGVDELNWLIKIDSNESITRTLQKSGYPNIPIGNYNCGFGFYSLYKIEREKRKLHDGRIWIGKIYTKSFHFMK